MVNMSFYTKRFLALFIAVLGMANFALAANNAPLKVGVIDSRTIIEKSAAFKDVRTQIEAKFKEHQTAATKMQEDLKKRDQDLESKRTVLSKDAFEKQSSALTNEAEEANKKVYMQRMSIDQAFQEALAKIEDALLNVVAEHAKADSITLVLQKMQTLYNEEAMDISEAVAKLLDKKLPKVIVVFQDPATLNAGKEAAAGK